VAPFRQRPVLIRVALIAWGDRWIRKSCSVAAVDDVSVTAARGGFALAGSTGLAIGPDVMLSLVA
jgi:hypothetical protein